MDFFEQFVKDGILTIDNRVKGQKSAILKSLNESFSFVNDLAKGDSKEARGLVLQFVKKIKVIDKNGNVSYKKLSNVTKSMMKEAGVTLKDIAKSKVSVGLRNLQAVITTLDPQMPLNYKDWGKLLGPNWKGHIHHIFPIRVLGEIVKQLELAANPDWDGKSISAATKTLLKKFEKEIGFDGGNALRNLAFLGGKEGIKLHDRVHRLLEANGVTPGNVRKLLETALKKRGPGTSAESTIFTVLKRDLAPHIAVTRKMVDKYVAKLSKGQIGNLLRTKGFVKDVRQGVLSPKGVVGGLTGAYITSNLLMNKSIGAELGDLHNAIDDDGPFNEAMAELLVTTGGTILGSLVSGVGMKRLGATALLTKLASAAPPVAGAVGLYLGGKAAVDTYSGYLESRTGVGLGEHWSRFQDKRASLYDNFEAGERLKDEPLQGEWGQGKNTNLLEKIGISVKNRKALFEERFDISRGDWGLSELLYGR